MFQKVMIKYDSDRNSGMEEVMEDERIAVIDSGARRVNLSEMMRLSKTLDTISGRNYRKGRVIKCFKCNCVGQLRKIDNSYICIQCFKEDSR